MKKEVRGLAILKSGYYGHQHILMVFRAHWKQCWIQVTVLAEFIKVWVKDQKF